MGAINERHVGKAVEMKRRVVYFDLICFFILFHYLLGGYIWRGQSLGRTRVPGCKRRYACTAHGT